MIKTHKITWLIIAIIIIVAVWLIINEQSTTLPTNQEPIKIGAILALTGDAARWGEFERLGIELALEEINNQGGINGQRLELVVEDFSLQNTQAISAFNKLTQIDGVSYITGPTWTDAFLVLAPLSAENKIIMISPSASILPENSPYAFSTWPPDALASRLLAEHIHQADVYNLAILAIQNEWAKNWTTLVGQRFLELNGKIVFQEEISEKARDVKTQLLKIQSTNPDAVLLIANVPEISQYLKESEELGIKLPVYTPETSEDQELLDLVGQLADGIIYLLPKEARNEKFINAFLVKYGKEPAISADEAYDAMMLLAKGISDCGTNNPDCIRQNIVATQNYTGASGIFYFNEAGEIIKDFVIKTIRGGQFVPLEQ